MDRYATGEIKKEHNGKTYSFPFKVKAENVGETAEKRFTSDEEMKNIKKELGDKPAKTDPVNNNTVEFTTAATRENIKSGETLSIIGGKIHKFFADLKAAAFCNVTNSITTGADADVTTKRALKEVNNKFGGLHFTEDADGNKYVVGADSVPKKLGSGLEYITCILKTKSRDISVSRGNDVDPYYGNVAEFDITRLPGYQNCVLGEDIFVEINLLGSTQGAVNYGSYIAREDQMNDPDFNYNTVQVTDYSFERDIDTWKGEETVKSWRLCAARYVPATGKLYVITAHTATAEIIALFRT